MDTTLNETLSGASQIVENVLFTESGVNLTGLDLSEIHTLSDVVPWLFLPKTPADAGILAEILGVYAQANYWNCVITMFFVFVTLQSFNIPGTIFLNLMMGCLFGYVEGVTLGVMSGTCGAMIAFTISKRWGGSVVNGIVQKTGMQDKMDWFRVQVAANDNIDLLLFLIFLRISPVLPNWFINAVSPHVNVPAVPLAVATAIGIAPQTIIAVHGGVIIRDLINSGRSHPLGYKEWGILCGLALGALVPLIAKKSFERKPSKSREPSRSPSVQKEDSLQPESEQATDKNILRGGSVTAADCEHEKIE